MENDQTRRLKSHPQFGVFEDDRGSENPVEAAKEFAKRFVEALR